jgi:hypothetical protein
MQMQELVLSPRHATPTARAGFSKSSRNRTPPPFFVLRFFPRRKKVSSRQSEPRGYRVEQEGQAKPLFSLSLLRSVLLFFSPLRGSAAINWRMEEAVQRFDAL